MYGYSQINKMPVKDTAQIRSLLRNAEKRLTATNRHQEAFDSATYFLSRARILNQKIRNQHINGEIALTTSRILRVRGDTVKGVMYAEKAAAIFRYLRDNNKLGESFEETAEYFPVNQWNDKVLKIYQAVALYRRSGNYLRVAHCFISAGHLNDEHQRYKDAIKNYADALLAYKRANYPRLQEVYIPLANLYQVPGDWKSIMSNATLALKCYRASKDTSSNNAFKIYNLLGLAKAMLDDSQAAIAFFYKARAVALDHKNIEDLYLITCNMAPMMIGHGRTTEGLKLLLFLQKNYAESKSTFTNIRFYNAMLSAYTQQRNLHLGRDCAEKLIHLSGFLKNGDKDMVYPALIDFYLMSGQMEQAGRYKRLLEALKNQNDKTVKVLADSIKNNSQSPAPHTNANGNSKKDDPYPQIIVNKEIQRRQKKFEAAENGQQVLSLIKLNQLQQANLRQTTITRDVTVGASILLGLLLLISFYSLRNKHRTNHQLQHQQQLIQQKNITLEKLITEKDLLLIEKEWLVKEIHHRVKNNLQIVISLLDTQSTYLLGNDTAFSAIRESQQRMQTIAIIHQKLYKSDNLTLIDIPAYIKELVTNICDSFNSAGAFHFRLDLDPVELDVSQAVPMGLILNEAITNAVKYAFRHGDKGNVIITLRKLEQMQLTFSVCDDGPGFPAEFNIDHIDSLGVNLMKGLSRQLGGSLDIKRNEPHTILSVTFEQKHFNEPQLGLLA